MTDYPYDPDLPFAVVGAGTRTVYARFLLDESACIWASTREGLEVIDTTPKPRIPGDAEFITWSTPTDGDQFAARVDGYWVMNGLAFSTDEILDRAGTAEIIVLDRRKDDV